MNELPSEIELQAAYKANILIEALPWLQRFAGERVVIKYGGHAMVDDRLKRAFAQDVQFLRQVGLYPIVVHGGGPQINAMLERLGIASEFRGGLRVTTPEVRDVVRMVLTGQVQRELVGLINEDLPYAVGLSGEDGGLMTARRTTTVVAGEEVDVGLVGEVVDVHPGSVQDLLQAGRIPVISTVAPDADGDILNVNADTAAAAIASAFGAYKLVMLTDVAGLYARFPDPESLMPVVSMGEVEEMMSRLSAGMIPKMQACLKALHGGVPQAHIVDGRVPHSLLLEIFTDRGVGTAIHGPSSGRTGLPQRDSSLSWHPVKVEL